MPYGGGGRCLPVISSRRRLLAYSYADGVVMLSSPPSWGVRRVVPAAALLAQNTDDGSWCSLMVVSHWRSASFCASSVGRVACLLRGICCRLHFAPPAGPHSGSTARSSAGGAARTWPGRRCEVRHGSVQGKGVTTQQGQLGGGVLKPNLKRAPHPSLVPESGPRCQLDLVMSSPSHAGSLPSSTRGPAGGLHATRSAEVSRGRARSGPRGRGPAPWSACHPRRIGRVLLAAALVGRPSRRGHAHRANEEPVPTTTPLWFTPVGMAASRRTPNRTGRSCRQSTGRAWPVLSCDDPDREAVAAGGDDGAAPPAQGGQHGDGAARRGRPR